MAPHHKLDVVWGWKLTSSLPDFARSMASVASSEARSSDSCRVNLLTAAMRKIAVAGKHQVVEDVDVVRDNNI